ncbi:MAG: hypothetical protein ACI85O_002835 [Saprospiraceae bacterium]|jgi:hypothetical protein
MTFFNTHSQSRDVKFAFLVFIICLLISFSKESEELLIAAVTAIP